MPTSSSLVVCMGTLKLGLSLSSWRQEEEKPTLSLCLSSEPWYQHRQWGKRWALLSGLSQIKPSARVSPNAIWHVNNISGKLSRSDPSREGDNNQQLMVSVVLRSLHSKFKFSVYQ